MHGNHKYTWGRSRTERERLVAAALEYFFKKTIPLPEVN
jgi:hypothetical protein